MRPLGIGIVGCGGAALDICRGIDATPGLRLSATYDRNPANAADLAGLRGGTAHDTLANLLADPAVDIVYVGLPHYLLATTVDQALAAGRHVLVEKPMALDPAEARRLGRVATERGLKVGVNFQQRRAGTVLAARELVGGGAIGTVRVVRIATVTDKPATYYQSGWSGRVSDDWRIRRELAGGGVVLMNSIHLLDVFRFVTGLAVVRVTGDAATLSADVEIEDAAAAALRLDNGGLVNLTANAHSAGATQAERIEIDGSDGRIDLPDPYSGRPVRLYLRRAWRDYPAREWVDVAVPQVDVYTEMVRSFAEAVRTGTEPPATAEDAAAALATVLAVYESSRTGRAVVLSA